jgi:2-methylcitrate dehydratase PrpD
MPIHVVPAALAVGEKIGASGSDLLAAIITGYDVAARVGISARLRAEIHPHGTYPALGAAATAARLHRMTADQIGEAMALAFGLSLVPPFETGYQGAFVRNVLSGYGAYIGVLAVDLVRAGVTPERDPIGSLYGSIVSPWHDPNLLVEDLGKRWECTRGYIKPYPSVRYGHPAIEAAEILRKRHTPVPDKIDRVLVETYNLPATLSNRYPDSELAAKFSLPWAIASILVRGTAGPDDFRALADPSIRRISRLVEVVEDTSMTARTPQDRPARVTVWISGAPLAVEVDRSAGGPDKPLPSSRVVAKFRSLADPVIGQANAKAVIQQVQELTDLARIEMLTSRLALNG